MPCNVQNDGEMEAVFEEIQKKWGRLDFALHSIAFAPMAELGKACLDRGLITFPFGNRINVAPPLNLSDAEAADGLAILDEVLSVADGYVT